MKQRLKYFILPIVTVILEMLPYGAVCNFANPNGEPFRETYSYFDLLPFGYANFSPLLTAVVSLVILILMLIYVITNKSKLLKPLRCLLLAGVLLSLCPLLLGITFFSIVGALITLTLIFEYLLIKLKKTL